jgi:ABC-type lipoprotein export system ATPase subunit
MDQDFIGFLSITYLKMSRSLFQFKNIQCGYHDKVVLDIYELTVPKVPLIFVLGPSGIGKSTFLEMAGLMTKTQITLPELFTFHSTSENVDLKSFWSWPETEQATFRKSKFSFVFQQTNLMQNFSILENMCVPLLIQGKSFEEAAAIVSGTAQQMDLPSNLLQRPITEASGGQLQRIAFTRALSANFEVLFGDEPTGNLDPGNARNLMDRLKENLTTRNASAIVVSHDLNLAENYADCIIQIEKKGANENFHGVLSNRNISLK